MGKIINFKIAKKNIENKKKINDKKNKKLSNYKLLLLIFAVILAVTSLLFFSFSATTPQNSKVQHKNIL